MLSHKTEIILYAVAQSTLEIKDIFSSFEEAALNIGLKINEDKTKYMAVSKQERRRIRQNITINDHNFEVVKEFKYLGPTITNDNKLEREVEMRIMAGNRSFFAMQHLMKSKLLSRGTQIRIYKTIIRPAVAYGSETWTLTKRKVNKLLVWERKILRMIYGPYRDSVTNEWRGRYNNELESLFELENLDRYIKANRFRWTGHVIRSNDYRLINNVFCERPDERRSVG
ncbi:unnamed protein product [Diabrotica balteata]|uniref:Reverse transcriptase domain-containing protein n=1 Tax=Diabrotica balteata TaxID=107213 RepID=A0A9N9XC73_DIABA|nr:unnamed protein product [Diabrotica balteata]